MRSLILLGLAACLGAADWPHYLGPDRDGSAPVTGLAASLPQRGSGMRVFWRTPVGPGYGGPAVQGGEVFLLDREEQQRDVLRCLDLADGSERWRYAYAAPGALKHDGSRSTPTVTADRVYTVGPFGQVHCFDRATRGVRWTRDLVADYAVVPLRWGMSHSPVLHDGRVILAPQGARAGLVALDAESGEELWRCTGAANLAGAKGRGSYVTPVVCTLAGVEQLVFATACFRDRETRAEQPGCVLGVDPASGEVLWTYAGWQCAIPIASPTPVPGDRLFVTGAYGAGSAMIRVRRGAAGWEVEELFTSTEAGGQIHRPLLHDGHLYLLSNGKERHEGLMCLDLDGTVRWHTSNSTFSRRAEPDLPNFGLGGAVLADGRIYALDDASGRIRVVEPTPAGYRELGCSEALVAGRELWAPLALAGHRLLLRDHEQLLCVDLGRAD